MLLDTNVFSDYLRADLHTRWIFGGGVYQPHLVENWPRRPPLRNFGGGEIFASPTIRLIFYKVIPFSNSKITISDATRMIRPRIEIDIPKHNCTLWTT